MFSNLRRAITHDAAVHADMDSCSLLHLNSDDLLCIKPQDCQVNQIGAASHQDFQTIADKDEDLSNLVNKLGYNPSYWRIIIFKNGKFSNPSDDPDGCIRMLYAGSILLNHFVALQQQELGDILVKVHAGGRWSTFLTMSADHGYDNGIYSQLIHLNGNLFSGCDIHYSFNDRKQIVDARVHYPTEGFPIQVSVIDIDNQGRSRVLSTYANISLCDLLSEEEMVIGSSFLDEVKYYSEGINSKTLGINDNFSLLDIGFSYSKHIDFNLTDLYRGYEGYMIFIVTNDWLARPKLTYNCHFIEENSRYKQIDSFYADIYANLHQMAWIIHLQALDKWDDDMEYFEIYRGCGCLTLDEYIKYPDVQLSVIGVKKH